ncbi:hypothetical protein PWT90_09592 [Aphanocladium album]|nr:hypothetical protein PWT90_09592 [Aphanocladium album]
MGDQGDPGLPPLWTSPRQKFYGPETEQFAFGSIVYSVTRGFEPYEDKGPETTTLFRHMVFPELSDFKLDVLTLHCWRSEFATLAELAEHCATLDGASLAATAKATDDAYLASMKATCEELMRTKLADLGHEVSHTM